MTHFAEMNTLDRVSGSFDRVLVVTDLDFFFFVFDSHMVRECLVKLVKWSDLSLNIQHLIEVITIDQEVCQKLVDSFTSF